MFVNSQDPVLLIDLFIGERFSSSLTVRKTAFSLASLFTFLAQFNDSSHYVQMDGVVMLVGI